MAYIIPSVTDKGLEKIYQRLSQNSELSNFPKFTLPSGIQIQKPYTNYILDAVEKLNLVHGYVDMVQEYNFRPDYVAYDYYGTTNLYWFVLYTNRVRTLLEFTTNHLKKIKIYRKQDVDLLLDYIMKGK